MNYEDFLKKKDYVLESGGFNIDKDKLNSMLFDFQKDVESVVVEEPEVFPVGEKSIEDAVV